MDKNIKELQDIRSKITRINISIEQDKYINKTDSLSILNKKLTKLEQKYKQGAKDILADKFLIYCSYLKAKSNTVFSLQKELIESLKHYNIISQESIDDYITPFLLDLDSTYLGKLYTIAGSGKEEIQNVVHFSWKMLNAPLFHINKTPISIVKIVITLIIFLIGFIISQIYRKYIKKLSHRNRAITDSSSTLLANMGHYLIFTITFFVVLKFLGIDLSSLALVAGALSVGIGFGLQNIISNFVSGIILMIERSIKIGDYIQIDENLRGRVVDIKMRSITITTNANIDVIVPNQELIQQKVINWTMNDKICRFEIPFGVAYGSDAKKVIDTVLKAVKESGYKDIYEDRYKITRVIMTEMGNSSVNFNLFVWIKGGEVFFPKRTQSRFLVLIYEALNKNGIEIPFPQQDIHIRSIDKDIPITIKKDNDA
jgi:small-conductance mechanosensitive channel